MPQSSKTSIHLSVTPVVLLGWAHHEVPKPKHPGSMLMRARAPNHTNVLSDKPGLLIRHLSLVTAAARLHVCLSVALQGPLWTCQALMAIAAFNASSYANALQGSLMMTWCASSSRALMPTTAVR